ncbi:peptidoglycan DD-metalloendopeptidase family protein [Streptomyces sp. NPDC003401]
MREGGAYGESAGPGADDGHVCTYCPSPRRQVKAGARVTAGRRFGGAGKTGDSTGPHPHFEMPEGDGGVRPRGGTEAVRTPKELMGHDSAQSPPRPR